MPPEVARTSVSTGGSEQYPSSLTVTTEYAPLDQEQVDHVINGKRMEENALGAVVGLGVALTTGYHGWSYQAAAATGPGVQVLAANRGGNICRMSEVRSRQR